MINILEMLLECLNYAIEATILQPFFLDQNSMFS